MGDGGGYEADRMARVVENYYEKLEENIRAITEKFRKEMMEDFQKLREKWRAEREEAATARAAANRKREKDKVVGEEKKKKKRRVNTRVVNAAEVRRRKNKGQKKKRGKTEVTGRRKKKKEKIKKKRTKGRNQTGGRSRRLTESFAGEGNDDSRTFNHQRIGRACWWPDGRRRTEIASLRARRGQKGDRRLRKLLDGSFRGGGCQWERLEARSERAELGFGGVGEIRRGSDKEGDEVGGSILGGERCEGGSGGSWLQRVEDRREGEAMGGESNAKREEEEGEMGVGMGQGFGTRKGKERGGKKEYGGPFFWGRKYRVQVGAYSRGPVGKQFFLGKSQVHVGFFVLPTESSNFKIRTQRATWSLGQAKPHLRWTYCQTL